MINVDYQFAIKPAEYEARIQKTVWHLKERGIDLGIGYSTPFMPGCMRYLTGFEPHIETAALAVGEGGAYILAGPEVEAMARPANCPPVMKAGHVRTLLEFQVLPQKYAHVTYCSLKDVLGEVACAKPIRKIGIMIRREFLPVYWLDMLTQALGGDVEYVDAQDILDDMRYHKSPDELKAFGIAAQISAHTVDTMIKHLKPGMRELELTALADYTAKMCGADTFSMDAIVMSGFRNNTVVGRGTNKIIQEGELVSLGFSARIDGYAATVARTVVAGKASAAQLEFLDHMARTLDIAQQNLVAGKSSGAMEKAAADYLRQVELHDYLCYSIAHGIGLTEVLDEKVPRGDDLFESNTTLMMDVGLFFHPQYGGGRIENPYIILADGTAKCATDYPTRVYRN